MFLKRIFLFGLVNILIVVTLSAIINLLGIQPYMTHYGIDYQALAVFCLVWGMGGSFISLLLSKFMAKTFMGVRIIDANGPYRDLVAMVHRYSQKAGLTKLPEVGVYESPEINAFATGPTRNNALVAVSTGLLNRLGQEELEGVIGHEVSHIANGDMVTMTLIQGVINAFVMFFARIVTFAIEQMVRDNDRNGRGLGLMAHMFIVMAFEMIFGFLGLIVVAFFSRWREFRADAGSAQLGGKYKMIRALKALQSNYEGVQQSQQAQSGQFQALRISNRRSWFALISTHPPLEERIAALERS